MKSITVHLPKLLMLALSIIAIDPAFATTTSKQTANLSKVLPYGYGDLLAVIRNSKYAVGMKWITVDESNQTASLIIDAERASSPCAHHDSKVVLWLKAAGDGQTLIAVDSASTLEGVSLKQRIEEFNQTKFRFDGVTINVGATYANLVIRLVFSIDPEDDDGLGIIDLSLGERVADLKTFSGDQEHKRGQWLTATQTVGELASVKCSGN